MCSGNCAARPGTHAHARIPKAIAPAPQRLAATSARFLIMNAGRPSNFCTRPLDRLNQ